MTATLDIRGLSKSFTHHLRATADASTPEIQPVLDDVDLRLEPGTMTVLTGPSGSGKSSLLRCVYRTYLPDAGQILLTVPGHDTIDLATADDHAVLAARRTHMGMVTQFLHVVPRVGATDLVAGVGGDRDAARDRLRALGLTDARLDDPPATFSGGERQIVNLALALAQPRPLLLLDEATASLDPERRTRALDALEAQKAKGTTMLAVFHDVPDRPAMVDRVLQVRDHRPVLT